MALLDAKKGAAVKGSWNSRKFIAGLIFAVAVLDREAIAQASLAAPSRLWEVKLPEQIVAISAASNGACLGVRTKSAIHVIDSRGRRSWEAPDILSPTSAQGALAVSPKCDWVAVFRSADDPESPVLRIIRKDGGSRSVSLAAASGVNAAHVSTLDISPDGQRLAVGFDTGYLWIVSRDGAVQTRVGPLNGAGVTARFTLDGKHVLVTGWFNDGLMNVDGTWVWKHDSRELIGSRKLNLFAALTAPMHGPQYGEIALLDASGAVLWKAPGYDAAMAVAPDGKFAVFTGYTEVADQPTQPPFPEYPALNEVPEIWIRDRAGKVLAHGPLEGRLRGVSDDSTCVLVEQDRSTPAQASDSPLVWFAGLSSDLREIWRVQGLTPFPLVAADLLVDVHADTIDAYRMPGCNHEFRNGAVAAPISIVQLIANPEEFDGKEVIVTGYAHLDRPPLYEETSDGIYASESDFHQQVLKNGLFLAVPSSSPLRGSFKDGYATIEGTFRKSPGHTNFWSGTISDIQRFENWRVDRLGK